LLLTFEALVDSMLRRLTQAVLGDPAGKRDTNLGLLPIPQGMHPAKPIGHVGLGRTVLDGLHEDLGAQTLSRLAGRLSRKHRHEVLSIRRAVVFPVER